MTPALGSGLPLPDPNRFPAEPPHIVLKTGASLVRIYRAQRRGVSGTTRRGGKPDPRARFDHLLPSAFVDRTVWYGSRTLRGSVAEIFGASRIVLASAVLHVALVELVQPIDLLDLTGPSVLRFPGLDQGIGTTRDYALTQAWARAWYEHFPSLAGIHWSGRLTGSHNVILTDRAPAEALRIAIDEPLDDPTILRRLRRAAHALQFVVRTY